MRHVIVCGHYGCGGVRTALDEVSHGVISNWLRPIRELAELRAAELEETESRTAYEDKLCEFNVQRQVDNLSNSTVVTDAWRRGHHPRLVLRPQGRLIARFARQQESLTVARRI